MREKPAQRITIEQGVEKIREMFREEGEEKMKTKKKMNRGEVRLCLINTNSQPLFVQLMVLPKKP